jgi:hypothetical protein
MFSSRSIFAGFTYRGESSSWDVMLQVGKAITAGIYESPVAHRAERTPRRIWLVILSEHLRVPVSTGLSHVTALFIP